MPKRKRTEAALALGARMTEVPKELIDRFVSGPMNAEAVIAATLDFKKALVEPVLGAELTHHLVYSACAEKPGEPEIP